MRFLLKFTLFYYLNLGDSRDNYLGDTRDNRKYMEAETFNRTKIYIFGKNLDITQSIKRQKTENSYVEKNYTFPSEQKLDNLIEVLDLDIYSSKTWITG